MHGFKLTSVVHKDVQPVVKRLQTIAQQPLTSLQLQSHEVTELLCQARLLFDVHAQELGQEGAIETAHTICVLESEPQ